jgi:hypothetical protein
VAESARKREAIQEKIAKLDKKRREYIAAERMKSSTSGKGLDDALKASIRSQAQKKGFTFNAN